MSEPAVTQDATSSAAGEAPVDLPATYRGFYEGRGLRGLPNRLWRLRGHWPDSVLALHDLSDLRYLSAWDQRMFAAGKLRLPVRTNSLHACVLVSVPDDAEQTSVAWVDVPLAPAVARLAQAGLPTVEACQGDDEDDAYLAFASCRAARRVLDVLGQSGVPVWRHRQVVEFTYEDLPRAGAVLAGLPLPKRGAW